MTAGPYSLSALYPDNRFELTAGEVVLGQCKSAGQHHFCKACFSWIYTKPAGLDDMVNIRTPMLDRAAEFLPFAEFFCGEGLPGMASGAPMSFDTAPEVDEFLALAEKYLTWAGRPD